MVFLRYADTRHFSLCRASAAIRADAARRHDIMRCRARHATPYAADDAAARHDAAPRRAALRAAAAARCCRTALLFIIFIMRAARAMLPAFYAFRAIITP